MYLSEVIELIKMMFDKVGNPADIRLLKGDLFKAELADDGIKVDNPGEEGLLPWNAFAEVVNLISGDQGTASAEDSSNNRPGNSGLYITYINERPAYVVFGGILRYSVYKRIAQITAILLGAEICRYEAGFIVINKRK